MITLESIYAEDFFKWVYSGRAGLNAGNLNGVVDR